MELSTLLIGIGTLILFIGPIIYLTWSQKKSGSSFSKQFLNLAQENDLHIDETDYWNDNYGIGIDAKAHKLLYLHKKENEENKYVVDLSKVEGCKVLNESRIVKGSNAEIIDKLALNLKFKDYKIHDKVLSFYNSEESLSLNDELLLAKKWADIINAGIK